MTERITQLALCIDAGTDTGAEELSERTGLLPEQLLELDIEPADPVTAGEAPRGACAAEIVVAGALSQRSVQLEIDGDRLEVTGIARKDQREPARVRISHHTNWSI